MAFCRGGRNFAIKLSKLTSVVHGTLYYSLISYCCSKSWYFLSLADQQTRSHFRHFGSAAVKWAAVLQKGPNISVRLNLEKLYRRENQRIRPNIKRNVQIKEVQFTCFQAFHQTVNWRRIYQKIQQIFRVCYAQPGLGAE